MSSTSALLDTHIPSSQQQRRPSYGSVSSHRQSQQGQATPGAGIGDGHGIVIDSLQDLEEGSRLRPTKKSDDEDYHDNDDNDGNHLSARRLFWTYVILTPILLSILVLFAGLLQFLPVNDQDGYIVHWDRFGIGMVGWTVAFGLRTPIFALVSKVLELRPYLCEWSTLVLGAAAEETARLGLLTVLKIQEDFGGLYWFGLGWAGMETLYYIGQSLIYSSLLSDNDYRAVASAIPLGVAEDDAVGYARIASSIPKDDDGLANAVNVVRSSADPNLEEEEEEEEHVTTPEVQHLLGIDRPWWSLMGRTSSMMVHLGLSFWLGYKGWTLLVPAILIHAAIYVLWGVFMPGTWSVPAASYGTMMTAMAIFLIGLALYGQIV
ncbi:hypothetical protein BGZ83_002879 [Gryganskiella cystojenkinii]|nr:hypothetical protein BGZ83_002879 [Gryganskiella cystojenkinii]